jgi:hypothetical protein
MIFKALRKSKLFRGNSPEAMNQQANQTGYGLESLLPAVARTNRATGDLGPRNTVVVEAVRILEQDFL